MSNPNHDAVYKVLVETGPIIATFKIKDWRATKRTTGQIKGVVGNVVVLATDGNCGIFQQDEKAFLGHIQHFTGKVAPLISSSSKMSKQRKLAKLKVLSPLAQHKKKLNDL